MSKDHARNTSIPPYKCFAYPDDTMTCVKYYYDPETGKYDKPRFGERVACSECTNLFTGQEIVDLLALRTASALQVDPKTLVEVVDSGTKLPEELNTSVTPGQIDMVAALKDVIAHLLSPEAMKNDANPTTRLFPNGINDIDVTIGFAPSPNLRVKISGL